MTGWPPCQSEPASRRQSRMPQHVTVTARIGACAPFPELLEAKRLLATEEAVPPLASVSARLLSGADSVFSRTRAHLGNVCCMLFWVTHPGRQYLSLTTEETEAQCGKAGPRLRHLWKCEHGVSLLLLLAPVYNALFPVDSLALPFISLLCPSSLWPVTTFVLLPGVQSPAQALAHNRHSYSCPRVGILSPTLITTSFVLDCHGLPPSTTYEPWEDCYLGLGIKCNHTA